MWFDVYPEMEYDWNEIASCATVSIPFHTSILNDFVKSVFQFQATELSLHKEYNYTHYFTFVRPLLLF